MQNLSNLLGFEPGEVIYDEQNQIELMDLSGLGLTHLPGTIGDLASIQILDLSGNSLTSLPRQIGKLRSLKRLYLSDNYLTDLPEEFGQLTGLEELNLDGNRFTHLPAEIGQLTHLWHLYLRNNQLLDLPPEFGQLENLNSLSLNGNQFKTLPPSIWQVTHLNSLAIKRNQLEQIPEEISHLSYLRNLSVDENQLEHFPSAVTTLQSLWLLSLANNRISEIPLEIVRLTDLRDLNLRGNALRALPPEIGSLKKLVRLSLEENQLESLPEELGQLPRLERLYLDRNRLEKIPPDLGGLVSLERLSLEDNQLGRFPPGLGMLEHLERLYLGGNQLAGLPSEVKTLTKLTHLYLARNELRHLPPEIGEMKKLTRLEVLENPDLLTPPPEIVMRGNEARLDFMRGLAVRGRTRYEAKLLLVGEGATGKSSLLRALRGEPFDRRLSVTHGIELGAYPLPHPNIPDETLTLNTWDFGGQQIYHATHQFFLTQRSFYLLVWNARMDVVQSNVIFWLDTIQAHAPNSPVVLVATHAEESPGDINYPQLKATYPQLVGSLAVSNETGKGIQQLQELLAEVAVQLPQMGQPWPEDWLHVEEALADLDAHHIGAEEYFSISQSHGVDLEVAQGSLGGFFHDLGKILYFRDDDLLSNLIVLRPNWVTKAISRVLQDDSTKEANGLLRHADLNEIWTQDESGQRYERHLYPIFLRLMERFDLSYQIQGETPGDPTTHSLIPQLLPHQPPSDLPLLPEAPPDGQALLEMYFHLSFVPAGIMSWFIVRTHRFTAARQWRDGVVLEYQGHTAFVELNRSLRQIRLFVWGSQPHNFFTILRETIDLILRRFEGLDIRREIPCICHWGETVDGFCGRFFVFEDLVRRLEAGHDSIQCPGTFQDVHVPALLFGIHPSTDPDVIAQLETNQQVLQVVLELKSDHEKIIEQSDTLLQQTAQMSELLNSNFSRLWNLEQQRIDAECPNTFILAHKDKKTFNPREWVSQAYLLTLVCQHPPHPHLVGEGYVLRQAEDWWITVSPWLNHLVKFLKFAVPKGKELTDIVIPDWADELESGLNIMTKILADVPEFTAVAELDRIGGAGVGLEPEQSVGSALRALCHLLHTVDEASIWED